MPLASGARLGPYEIVAAIGAGGMGEVYKATDTRLDRTVAVKVLPAHLAANAEYRQRLEREARAVAALNHPHICALYDIGSHRPEGGSADAGIDFLVLEYLEGETLSARLAGGPLAVAQVLEYAAQIADALDKAHRKELTHRDLKPGNIMLTKAGAKLLDFGLAKTAVRSQGAGMSVLPTQDAALTIKGTLLGTFQYMAPEQLSGQDADARSDIFAFGAVLYEMITARKAFPGTTPANVMGAILHTDPPALDPPSLDRVVKKCLAKDPDDRWQSAADLRSQLQWLAEAPLQPPSTIHHPPSTRRPWAVAAALALLLAAASVFLFLRKSPEVRAYKFSVLPPDNASFSQLNVSPDGRRLAFVAADASGRQMLWVRPLDSLTGQPLAGTEGAQDAFWSPDSRFVGFSAQGKLKKIEVTGGPPQALCDVTALRGGSWNRDGVIVFTRSNAAPLQQVSAAGGEPKPVTRLDRSRQEYIHRDAYFLPDGRHFLYLVRSGQPEHRGVFLGSLDDQPDSTARRRLLGDDSSAIYAPPQDGGSGHLLFRRSGVLMAQSFDARKLQLAGDPFPVADKVGLDQGFRMAASVSDTGLLIYDTAEGAEGRRLTWFDRQGKMLGSVGEPGNYIQPWLSPDEKRVAAERTETQMGTIDIWLLEISREVSTRFTFDPSQDLYPVWSPDGSRIVFASLRDGPNNLYQKMASGAGQEEPLLKTPEQKRPTDWSADGRFLAYSQNDPKTKWDLWILPMSGDRKPVPFLRTPFDEEQAHFSPDGRWIAYTSNESSIQHVYVQPYPATGAKFQVSKNGGQFPKWRRDGKELFFLAADRKLMVADIRADPAGASFEADTPKALFQTRLEGPNTRYTVTRDGQRFLMPVASVEQVASTPATVVVNWTAGLRR